MYCFISLRTNYCTYTKFNFILPLKNLLLLSGFSHSPSAHHAVIFLASSCHSFWQWETVGTGSLFEFAHRQCLQPRLPPNSSPPAPFTPAPLVFSSSSSQQSLKNKNYSPFKTGGATTVTRIKL